MRAFCLVGLLTGVALLFFRWLWQPLRTPTDNLSLALRIEDSFPILNDSLASTVQFLAHEDAETPDSASLRQEAVRRALRRAERINFYQIVDSRGLRTASLSMLAAASRRLI